MIVFEAETSLVERLGGRTGRWLGEMKAAIQSEAVPAGVQDEEVFEELLSISPGQAVFETAGAAQQEFITAGEARAQNEKTGRNRKEKIETMIRSELALCVVHSAENNFVSFSSSSFSSPGRYP